MKFVLTVIVEPTIKLYYVSENKFSTKKEDAFPFMSREAAMIEQDRFLKDGLDTQIEEYEE